MAGLEKEQQLMLEDQIQLKKQAEQIASDIVAANLAQKRFYTDQRLGKEYYNLITPDAFDKDLIAIAVLGYPEQVGVWSYTLLRQERITETGMGPYFNEFGSNDIGLVAINPNSLSPDIEGDSFIYQLEQVIADIAADKKIGFIGFSMGGKVLVEFLEQRPSLLDRTAGLALIDPTLPNRLNLKNIRHLLDNDTLLIASESDLPSPGTIASALLQIPKIPIAGIHGQMPNKALPQVISFFKQRTH